MIGALRRVFRRRRPRKPLIAPVGEQLRIAVARTGRVGAGELRAATRIGGLRFSLRELGDDEVLESGAWVPLEELLDQILPLLDGRARSELFDFVLGNLLADLEKPGAMSLAASLHLVRDRLRTPLPELQAETDVGPLVTVDAIAAIDDRSYWFVGWSRDGDDPLVRLEVVSPEGQRAELLDGAHRFHRPDVRESLAAAGIRSTQKHGFAKYVELPAPSLLDEGWLCELRNPAGGGFQTAVPHVTRDHLATYNMITELAADQMDVGTMRREHGYPALQRLQSRISSSTQVDHAVQYGEPPASVDVSIVVPLYDRIDLIEHQVAQFWEDPEIGASELIYVLDSPELAQPLARLAAGLHELYGLPFKVVTLNRNSGYSTANNVAASLARGRLLLLLNSDVLPAASMWLGRMVHFYDATPEVGALGPKLLYEDDSIQHAGMYFRRDVATGYWENQHYFKGFSRSLPAANVTRPVPAVTAACLMIERALWGELGGLSDAYVRGGYEDSDLCLRVLDAGRRNWYLANVELYHLEAQSFPIGARRANRYNAWLQTHLWDERIEEVMCAQADLTAPIAALA
jgi:GT2 family glycosyltransferase